MVLFAENSGFENSEYESAVVPENATVKELLHLQSTNSTVYKIRINDKWLLLKRIIPEHRSNPLYEAALDKEFNIGFHLDHPNIVKYLNKGKDQDGPYIIAEFIDGFSLREIISKNPKGINDLKYVEKIALQILDVLDYLHSRQIFHLDLKPENILITHKGNNVKIIDFGLSGSDSYHSISSGTKNYCAPEQLTNPKMADARSDIYSFGILLLEMVSGSNKIEQKNHLSFRYKKIVSMCTMAEQSNRYASVDEITSTLLKAKKRSNGIILFTGFAILFIVLSFFLLQNDNQKDAHQIIDYNPSKSIQNKRFSSIQNRESNNEKPERKNNHLPTSQYDKMMKKSKTSLDSLSRAWDIMFSTPLPAEDSIVSCQIADEIYPNFINKMKAFDQNPTNQNRKIFLIDLKSECLEQGRKDFEKYFEKYGRESMHYYNADRLFRKHELISWEKMDLIIYPNKKQ